MKVTFPHMGNLYIPVKTFFENLGVEVIVPPPCSKKTLELGVKYSPEFACLPLKINIGNFIEALEMGADTIVMAGGIGPCRFGYYSEVQREILRDLGYKFNMIVLDPPQGHFMDLVKKLLAITNKKSFRQISLAGRLAWAKALLLDELDKMASAIRPVELNRGETDAIYKNALEQISKAESEQELLGVRREILERMAEIKKDPDKLPVKIGLVGEIYTVLEPFVNLFVERQLGELGAAVERSIYITEWVRENLLPSFLKPKEHGQVLKLAEPYIRCFVGGHGQESIAQIVKYSREGFDGVIHLLPFTCMPEIVAKSTIPSVARIHSIPVMTLVLDEHSAEAGVRTRLEAFVDLIRQKKEEKSCDRVLSGN
ncbi:acyl-CoA dehydratase activase-related protein [Thermosediminibacter litoriperuensis]|uniref:Putative nucleotide-binding protein (Sugar kinase/HSP70/actin superfamily) n=1 Tax=Thermosediminibacter litoriperuensis TaxID=291989 RepID=A0A5S5ARF6_9FIRM|nr:acyl-CoA dehydratase activase-related protein [Thermosediminibacter litoriperuensis]TYP54272.1 putative nucleotide-binding protein (sugar kinase/HSP70/actin superfamily) [Thermosediminibacter litoriperuensis]